MNRTERLHALTESLRRAGRRGRTAEALATEFEVSTRTVKRDLRALAESGLPVWARTGPGGGFGLSEASALPPVNLSPAQVVALGAAVTVAAGAPYADSARAAHRKVLDVLDPEARRRAQALAKRIWVDLAPSAPRRVLSPVEQALADQRTVRIRYVDRRDVETRREVEPMIVAHNRNHWYLVGWCLLRDDVRWFELSRIRSAAATRRPCSGRSVALIGTPPDTAGPVTV